MPETLPGVLFVCLGNICRSPTAQGVFEAMLDRRQLRDQVRVDSCGTAHWHVGEPPDARSVREAARRGVDISTLRGRQLQVEDFARFDYIIAMDRANLAELERQCPSHFRGELRLFLDYADCANISEVPDPYHEGRERFAEVLDLVEQASEGLLFELIRAKRIADATA
ncbi:MAG: low molecular weight phosphotyrosine protein phosphatase [Halioglobus sp.]|nr:low molecular weight phosphotyrosine protein phosphatase [Halioglobus sp.]